MVIRSFFPMSRSPSITLQNYEYGLEARSHFDPNKPTSLLYKKTADGGYKLVGAMYTDRVDATEDELNDRIPLSIARWHQHVNFCKAPMGQKAAYFGPDAKFGLLGPSPPKKPVRPPVGSSIPISLDGWCTFIHMRPTRGKSGPRTMTTRATTTWIIRRCRG